MSTQRKRPQKGRTSRKGKQSYNEKDRVDKREMRKNEPYDEKDMGRVKSAGADNDPNWYFTDARLAEQASQLSFQTFLGDGSFIGNAQIPTIMTLYMNPSPGVSYVDPNGDLGTVDYVRDGLNLMDVKLYTLLSSYSGRTSSYAPQDVGTMILAIGEVISLIEHLRRIFGVAHTYNMRNRIYPLEVINAMGVDADDLMKHLADYRMRLNTYITLINQIPLLDNIAYLRKCRDIYQKIYLDDPSTMAQTYVMVPYYTWIMDETSYSGGTILKSTVVATEAAKKTLDSIFTTILDPMIDALLQSSTMQIIYADLINLANKASYPTFKMDYVDEDYVVIPEYNRYFLLQVHNATPVGLPSGTTFATFGTNRYMTPANDVYPDPNVNGLIYNPIFAQDTFVGGAGANHHYSIVDMDVDNPDLVDRIEALRFAASWNGAQYVNSSTSTTYDIALTLPDHYLSYLCVYGSSGAGTVAGRMSVVTKEWTGGNATTMPNIMACLSQFHMAPVLKVAANYAGPEITILGELNYCTLIDNNYLSRLNRLIYTGLFDFRL